MKKWIVLFLALMLMLAVSSAFAGGPAEGNITVIDLQTNTYLTGDTVLTIDRDREEQSICGKTEKGDFTLKFVGGGHFLTFRSNSGAAVSAKNITFIGKNAFAGCTKLKTITIKNQKMKKSGFGSGCFARIQKKAVFYVPSKAFNNYKKWIVNRGKAPSTCIFIKK